MVAKKKVHDHYQELLSNMELTWFLSKFVSLSFEMPLIELLPRLKLLNKSKLMGWNKSEKNINDKAIKMSWQLFGSVNEETHANMESICFIQ